ncbi:hypothetical protein [Qipengyuania gelatinilytica]|uniref:Pectate lyase superfamily protein domain-containing protein n=1 Tax=Qipengyuania gelatinilytica TaxID=2867231 RepID=A0ABX9A4H9_9SPHN|nr:hypothetical protein [Qipengyuania gelatinilytica]QZD95952.1 hypothetical protein K3136_04365 [Qipengyuania gelatinilytica]
MTIVTTRADAIGQDFSGSDMIETTGFANAGDGGEGRYCLIDPASYSGAPADAGPGTIECLNGWYRLMGAELYIEQFGASSSGVNQAAADGTSGLDNGPAINAAIAFASANGASRIGARGKGRFGVGTKIVLDDERLTFGNGISPFSLDLVALTTNSFISGEGIVEVTKNRASLDGFWLRIPSGVWDQETQTGTQVSGVKTIGTSGNIYHNRVWNVEVIGGYKSFDLQGLEGDFRKTRARGSFAFGYHVTGADNEFSPSCTAADGDIGFYNSSGAEGAMHCVRNRINFHLDGGLPTRMFCFDDTPLETGIWARNLRGAHILTYHGKVGQHANAGATAHYVKLERCRHCTFENVGTYRAQDAATLAVSADAYFLDIPSEWNGDPWSSVRNRFTGYRLDDTEIAQDAATLRRVARNVFQGCEGTHVARLVGDNHQLVGEGVSLAAGATASFERYLSRKPGGAHPHILRVLGKAIVSRSETQDALVGISLRVPILDGTATSFAGTANVTEVEQAGSGNFAVSISNVVYDVVDNRIRFDLTGPANFDSKCEVVLTDVLCDNGAF